MLRKRKQSKVNAIESAACEGEGGEEITALTSVVRMRLIEKVTSEQRPKGDKAHCHADI